MAKPGFESVAQYIAALPRPTQAALEQVRAVIRKAMPQGAEEVISYQIPAFRLPGGVVIFFAGWKEHVSIYPATGLVDEVLGDQLAPYRESKGTLRFPLSEPLPLKLIERVAKLKAKEHLARVKAKVQAKRSSPDPLALRSGER